MKKRIAVTLAAIAASAVVVATTTSPANAAANAPPDYVVAEAPTPQWIGGGGNAIVSYLEYQVCINNTIDTYICAPVFSPTTVARAGDTIWIDSTTPPGKNLMVAIGMEEGIPSFADFVAYVTNGEADGIWHALQMAGGGGGGTGRSEAEFFGSAAGPSGFDLYGYAIHRIGLRIDAITIESPGSDPNGDGNWTDYSFRGTLVFEGTIASPRACTGDGWRGLRGPDGTQFESLTDCVLFAVGKPIR